ncbi:MAG TPA: peptidase S8, partial [Bacteroides sp.]|nr:peptidase S8 [Bacteroides sp.]
LQKKPYLTPAMVKMRLHDTAVSIRLPKEQQGWGMLDVKALLDS